MYFDLYKILQYLSLPISLTMCPICDSFISSCLPFTQVLIPSISNYLLVTEHFFVTEDEMVGWHHWLNGLGFGWTLGVGDGQRGLACGGSWVRKELDTTEWPNWALFCSFSSHLHIAFASFLLFLFFSYIYSCILSIFQNISLCPFPLNRFSF